MKETNKEFHSNKNPHGHSTQGKDMGSQCGERCPQNNDQHRGACSSNVGHTSQHTCSVNGHNW